MVIKTYEADVLRDGHLSVSEEVRSQLGLKEGDRVEVTIRRAELPAGVDPNNPLIQLIGICQGGDKTDLALKHDHYLYSEDAP
jgi:bifunctional DNA-binding transcriptional regulator/antitoxin component of YhaV-PrlF toxin-antitoxin module